ERVWNGAIISTVSRRLRFEQEQTAVGCTFATGAIMAPRTRRELYYGELRDLYDAERQIAPAFSNLASMATAAELKTGFERDVERRLVHVERLELLFDEYAQPKTGSRVTAIEALL